MTISRISAMIHGWLGWCPYTRMTSAKTGSDEGLRFPADTSPVKIPGPSGDGPSRDPRTYKRTQRGSLIIWSVTAVLIVILVTMNQFGIVPVAVFVACIMIAVLALFSTLTVSVSDETLRIRFGPAGLIHMSWPLAEIVSVTTVTNPWYYGWGIRWTPHGPLYNVSGFGAIEVRLLSGKTFRIGTGEPEALKSAIEQARG